MDINNFLSRCKISQIEILGLEVREKKVPPVLRPYMDDSLKTYKLLIRYHHEEEDCKRPKAGRCFLVLRTNVYNRYGLWYVEGTITLSSYCQTKPFHSNYRFKDNESCSVLRPFIRDHLASMYFAHKQAYFNIKNSLFTCKREAKALVNAYDKQGRLDQVSVNMNLFTAL